MNPEAGLIWRDNCRLANEIAERWKEQALLMRAERDDWKRVADRRIRIGFAYVTCFVFFVVGTCAGLALAVLP